MPAAALMKDFYSLEEVSISQAELHGILREHQRYLARQRGTRARLRSAKLDGLTMANRDLSEADLSGASLVGANLSGADLSRASLNCADLRDCDLRYARLDHADLRGASFKGANLSYASMDFADLRAATMLRMGDTLQFQGNTHQETLFGAVDFSNCSLRNASFRNAKLDNANFTDALLQDAVFAGARLKNACFRNAALSGSEQLSSRVLEHALPPPSFAAMRRAKELKAALAAHHAWFVSGGKKGKPAIIDGADLRPLKDSLRGLCLAGLSARRVIAVGVDLTACQLQAAKFDNADVRGACFMEADLSGTSFQHAKLAHASFRNARIKDFRLCSGRVLEFRTDTPLGAAVQFGDARIQSATFTTELDAAAC